MLSPWHTSEACAQVTLTPGGSDEDPRDDFGGLGFADDLIWDDRRPGRVSASGGKEYEDSHTNFDVISVS